MAEQMTKTIKSLNDFVTLLHPLITAMCIQIYKNDIVLKFPEIVYYNRNVIEPANKMYNFCKAKYKINCE